MQRCHAAVVGALIAHWYCVRVTSCVLQGSPFCDCACESACSLSCAIISGGIPSKRESDPSVRSMYLSKICLALGLRDLAGPCSSAPLRPWSFARLAGPLPPASPRRGRAARRGRRRRLRDPPIERRRQRLRRIVRRRGRRGLRLSLHRESLLGGGVRRDAVGVGSDRRHLRGRRTSAGSSERDERESDGGGAEHAPKRITSLRTRPVARLPFATSVVMMRGVGVRSMRRSVPSGTSAHGSSVMRSEAMKTAWRRGVHFVAIAVRFPIS